jgi:hypothetical protein
VVEGQLVARERDDPHCWLKHYLNRLAGYLPIYALREIFRQMPKPSDLHTHYNSALDYGQILRHLKQNEAEYYSELRYGQEKYKNMKFFALFPSSE